MAEQKTVRRFSGHILRVTMLPAQNSSTFYELGNLERASGQKKPFSPPSFSTSLNIAIFFIAY